MVFELENEQKNILNELSENRFNYINGSRQTGVTSILIKYIVSLLEKGENVHIASNSIYNGYHIIDRVKEHLCNDFIFTKNKITSKKNNNYVQLFSPQSGTLNGIANSNIIIDNFYYIRNYNTLYLPYKNNNIVLTTTGHNIIYDKNLLKYILKFNPRIFNLSYKNLTYLDTDKIELWINLHCKKIVECENF